MPTASIIPCSPVSRTGNIRRTRNCPPENAPSRELGVSRPVLRAALYRPREEGLIFSRQGVGSYVRIPVNAPVGFAWVETLADIQRCYEFAETFETKAARLAA
ncbi:FadR/GntR family transcriptional regulator [Puniceibacterium sediminis]|uniref:FadR/GntR family transcriptional regulator n=1 Tax=Puniceibacterium sediminis TaxID=1608407 RepID=UPI003CCB8DC5